MPLNVNDLTPAELRAITKAALDFTTVADACTRMAKDVQTTAMLNALSEGIHAKHQYEDRLRETCGAITEAHDAAKKD
jgi:regulator of sigma D